jgi:Skp family chaperone for outer membrane proteins
MRSLFRNSGVWLFVGMLFVVGPSLSEPKEAPPPCNRIGLINLMQLFKRYAKKPSFFEENKKLLEPYQSKARLILVQIEVHQKALQTENLAEEKRTELETNLIEYQSQFEEITKVAKKLFEANTEKQLVLCYKDISAVAKRYAVEHDLDLIVHYNDFLVDEPNYFGSTNVSRKIKARSLIPMHLPEGVDITNEMIAILNEAYRSEGKKP